MSFKPVLLGLGLVACLAVGAQAQTVSTVPVPDASNLANLPPEGPRASHMNSIPGYTQAPVVPSGAYPGPNAGAGTGSTPPRFQKPADWDQNALMRPYDAGKGPRPN